MTPAAPCSSARIKSSSDAEALCSRVADSGEGAAGRRRDGSPTCWRCSLARLQELVVAGASESVDLRVDSERPRASCGRCGSARSRYTLELPLDPPPERLLGELDRRRRASGVAQPDSRKRSRTSSSRASPRRACSPRAAASTAPVGGARESDRGDRRQRLPRIGPRQGALQPGAVRDAPDRRVVHDRSADGGAGHQDRQGSRAVGDVAVRPLHRRVHRHRAGLEGGRAPQHLRAAR